MRELNRASGRCGLHILLLAVNAKKRLAAKPASVLSHRRHREILANEKMCTDRCCSAAVRPVASKRNQYARASELFDKKKGDKENISSFRLTKRSGGKAPS